MEKQNKFKIVIPSYNNEKWVEPNIASILNQTYTNYDVLYINDASTDNTFSLVKELKSNYNLSNWEIINNPSNEKRGYNVSPYNKHIIDFMDNDEDILVFIDGDDWLFDGNVLSNLNDYYNTHNSWMTYGGMYTYPEAQPANPQNSPYSDYVHQHNLYRRDMWRASHLRTFKWWLYKKISKKDLIYSKTNKYYFHAEDLATSYPCLEMCPKEKIGVVDFPSYVFNQTVENRQRGQDREEMAGVGLENEIRNQTPYNTITSPQNINNFVTCKILGPSQANLGLGNQLFCIATTLNLAYKNKVNPVFEFSDGQAPYKDNIFKNLTFTNQINTHNFYKEPYFHYKQINYSPGLSIEGYFQSEKYFLENRKDILETFRIPNQTLDYINDKWGDLLKLNNKVSLHIRRGDYLLPQYSSHHPAQNLDYYSSAIKHFDENSNFLIFSDDIEWCKENFIGSQFNFIEGNPDYIDLWVMSLCDHNVIANSSFSWWGAWLNQNPNKIVIAPKKWFGPSYQNVNDNDLIPESWIKI